MSSLKEIPTSMKRHVHEIDDPEYPLASTSSCVHSGKILRGRFPEEELRALPEKTSLKLAKLQQLQPHLQITDGLEEADDGSLQNSSKDSVCSLPEFDIGDETIGSQETMASEVTPTAESTAILHAETLRLRLRVALFKVQTNQTNIPMSQLQISMHGPNKLLEPMSASSSAREERLRPKLLPAPILRPTAYSARTIPQQEIPTSPPDSTVNSPEPATDANPSSRLATPLHKHQSDPIQTSSPPDSPENMSVKVESWENSTRSAVRGKAAISLLDLRRVKQ
ncbi:hypothetical protein MMC29_003236 [Sticta canariensis]|nr:hypothetical protein [Sticta canariensis]